MCSPIEDQPLQPSIGEVLPNIWAVGAFYLFYGPWIVLVHLPHTFFVWLFVCGTFGFAGFLADHPTQTNFTHREFGVWLMTAAWWVVMIHSWRKGWRQNRLLFLTSLLGLVTILVFCIALPRLYVEHPVHERPLSTLLDMLCSEQMTYNAQFMTNLVCHTWECRRDKDVMGRPVIPYVSHD